jgi:hypothetical protein
MQPTGGRGAVSAAGAAADPAGHGGQGESLVLACTRERLSPCLAQLALPALLALLGHSAALQLAVEDRSSLPTFHNASKSLELEFSLKGGK